VHAIVLWVALKVTALVQRESKEITTTDVRRPYLCWQNTIVLLWDARGVTKERACGSWTSNIRLWRIHLEFGAVKSIDGRTFGPASAFDKLVRNWENWEVFEALARLYRNSTCVVFPSSQTQPQLPPPSSSSDQSTLVHKTRRFAQSTFQLHHDQEEARRNSGRIASERASLLQ
jgi:hypothetical protein